MTRLRRLLLRRATTERRAAAAAMVEPLLLRMTELAVWLMVPVAVAVPVDVDDDAADVPVVPFIRLACVAVTACCTVAAGMTLAVVGLVAVA